MEFISNSNLVYIWFGCVLCLTVKFDLCLISFVFGILQGGGACGLPGCSLAVETNRVTKVTIGRLKARFDLVHAGSIPARDKRIAIERDSLNSIIHRIQAFVF